MINDDRSVRYDNQSLKLSNPMSSFHETRRWLRFSTLDGETCKKSNKENHRPSLRHKCRIAERKSGATGIKLHPMPWFWPIAFEMGATLFAVEDPRKVKTAVKHPTVVVVESSSDAPKIRDDDGAEEEYYSSWCHLICQIQIQAIRPTTAGDLCFAVINIRL